MTRPRTPRPSTSRIKLWQIVRFPANGDKRVILGDAARVDKMELKR
jgi:hypothetical protein